ncbi:premnaspirodiene oxygenase-like [Triticum dicoccoides]|uniref:premnaspirodiene oxygenase-like n=1 Tax=Triticum dicoccoides TaxID=85692 RepID=UPI0018903C45|nr:premnaspirodiene oxygenase-like [Triticum dicoccoides]
MEGIYFQLLLVSLVALALQQLLKLAKKPSRRTPPRPWKLPVIGSLHHLMNVLPHRALRDLANVHGPLMMLQLGETPLVVASSKEMAREGTRTRKLYTTELLCTGRVLSFRHVREEEVMVRVEQIRKAGPSTPVNLSLILHELTTAMLLRAAWGKTRIKNMPELLAGVRTGIALSSGFSLPDLFQTWKRSVLAGVTGMKRSLESLHKTIDSVFEEVIEERMCARAENVKTGAENVDENLVDVLIGMQEKGDSVFPIDKPRIKAFLLVRPPQELSVLLSRASSSELANCSMQDTLAAGTGTSGSAMEWTMSELIRNPKVMAKLQEQVREAFRGKAVVTEGDMQAADIRYLKLVMKEALRLHPPAPLLVGRESIDVCEVDGYTIPAKSRVLVNVWAIGQDPKYWDAPEEFKPERFEKGDIDFMGSHYEFTTFGAGRRMCPGISYGLASMELALVSLLYHFDWSLPEGVSELDMGEAPGLGVRRRSPLLLRATPVLPADCAE